MVASSIRPNQVFKLDETIYRLVEKQGEDAWHIQRMCDRQSSTMTHNRLLELYASGALELRVNDLTLEEAEAALKPAHAKPQLLKRGQRAKPDLVSAGEDTFETTAKRRRSDLALALRKAKLAWVAAEYPWGSTAQIDAIREAWPSIFKAPAPDILPNTSTLHRWYTKLSKAGNNASALIPRHDQKGRRKLTLPERLQALVEEVTEEHYLQPKRISLKGTYGILKDRIRAENAANDDETRLQVPPLQRLREYIESLSEFDKHAARYGHAAAMKKFRTVLKMVHASKPLERVELDATLLDIWILDDTGVPMGRPWLHVCIDVRTRCILGYYLSFEPPSLATFFECLQHAVLPKSSAYLAKLEVDNPWPFYGAMQRLVLDNALENHSAALDELAALWGLEVQFCPRRRPWYKAKVERFLRSLNSGLCHTLPGSTFSNIFDRGDAKPQQEAVLTWSVFEKMLAVWINDVYHQRKHGSLDGSPAQEWAKLVRERDLLLPCRPKAITQIARTSAMCRLAHTGIQRFGLFWNSARLGELRKQIGAEVDVKVFFNHTNLGDVCVQHPITGEMIDVPSLRRDYASNLTLFQHQKIRAYAQAESLADDSDGYLAAEAKIRRLIADAMALRNYALPPAMARFLTGNGQRSELARPGDPAANDEPVACAPQAGATKTKGRDTSRKARPKSDSLHQAAARPKPAAVKEDTVVTAVVRRRRVAD